MKDPFEEVETLLMAVKSFLHDEHADVELKVSVYDIEREKHTHIRGAESGWAASIIKVPVMNAVLEQIAQGNLYLDDQLPVRHEFMLESFDRVSKMDPNAFVDVKSLLIYDS